jgi:hypothetical protein
MAGTLPEMILRIPVECSALTMAAALPDMILRGDGLGLEDDEDKDDFEFVMTVLFYSRFTSYFAGVPFVAHAWTPGVYRNISGVVEVLRISHVIFYYILR